jgi:hypothetical protein
MSASGRERRKPLVLGGSLTAAPEGDVLQTLQTHGQYPSPITMQQVWSNASQRRYPEAWQGQSLPSVGFIVEWKRCRLTCGHCGHSLGRYVAYRARDEWGVVEDSPKRGRSNPSHSSEFRRFQTDGEIGRRAAKSAAIITCRKCNRVYRRNLAHFSRTIWDAETSIFALE